MEGILHLSKRRLGVIVEKSTLPGIHQYDEVVEINNVRADILDKATLHNKLLELISISNLLILPINKQQLIQYLIKLLNDKKFSNTISKNCYTKTKKYYRWEVVLKKYNFIF